MTRSRGALNVLEELKWCPKDHGMRGEILHRMGQGVCVCQRER